MAAGWDANEKIMFGWGYIPNSGTGWFETPLQALNQLHEATTTPWAKIFKDGPKNVDELNEFLPVDKKINCEASSMTLPNGQKILI